jgi:probable biosynthetic protein (TIGR04098 family)
MSGDTRVQRATVKPAMCGPTALFLGQIGDWTWDTVSEACHTNVFKAKTALGLPAYLAFYYYRVRASESFHVDALSFGDSIEVRSNVFGFGSESVLTLHEIRPGNGRALDASPIDCAGFYESPQPGCIYVENFNRWVTRSAENSNEGLVVSSPPEFQVDHLPRLPEQYSPRVAYTAARRQLTFLPSLAPSVSRVRFEYAIDVTRDVNGVGLVYFASYFAIVDGAVFRIWRDLGRDERSFLQRVVVDRQICYTGNADVGAVLSVDATLRTPPEQPELEIFDVVLRVRGSERLIAVSTVRISRRDFAA